ncbi:MAG TPA: hypothetical protein VGK73_30915 [Polyangiaceae bacterium]
MPLSLTPLLIHSDAVPHNIRSALIAATAAPPERRTSELVSVARLLYAQTSLDCRDARELVGLEPNGHCQ